MATKNHQRARKLVRPRNPEDITPEGWIYTGDRDICAGGAFIDMRDYRHGYAQAVRVTDLDSAAGADGMLLVERITIIIDRPYRGESQESRQRDRKQMRDALGYSGLNIRDIPKEYRKAAIAQAALDAGRYDPQEDYHTPTQLVIQGREDEPMTNDGWKATARVLEKNFLGYLWAEWIRPMA